MMLEMIVGRRPSAEHNPRSAHGPRLLAPSPIREQELLSARFQSVGYSMEDIMEHRTSAELKGFAAVIRPEKLSRKELLERWASALEKRQGAGLRTLREIEYKLVKERSALLRQRMAPLGLSAKCGGTPFV